MTAEACDVGGYQRRRGTPRGGCRCRGAAGCGGCRAPWARPPGAAGRTPPRRTSPGAPVPATAPGSASHPVPRAPACRKCAPGGSKECGTQDARHSAQGAMPLLITGQPRPAPLAEPQQRHRCEERMYRHAKTDDGLSSAEEVAAERQRTCSKACWRAKNPANAALARVSRSPPAPPGAPARCGLDAGAGPQPCASGPRRLLCAGALGWEPAWVAAPPPWPLTGLRVCPCLLSRRGAAAG